MPSVDQSRDQLVVIARDLLDWYRVHRRELPWRLERDPYRIWISEIMLQQTQVITATPHYERFVRRFPTLADLAQAETDEVLRAWEGLGYYSRARNLHAAVKEVQANYGGEVPSEPDQLRQLPGIGEYTAGAIASIAYNRSEPAVDGNVLRVITRLFSISDDIGLPATRRRVSSLVRQMIPDGQASDFTQALMELGALVCSPAGARLRQLPAQRFLSSPRIESRLIVASQSEAYESDFGDDAGGSMEARGALRRRAASRSWPVSLPVATADGGDGPRELRGQGQFVVHRTIYAAKSRRVPRAWCPQVSVHPSPLAAVRDRCISHTASPGTILLVHPSRG